MVLLGVGQAVLPANTQLKGELRADLPIVLRVAADERFTQVGNKEVRK